MFKRYAPSADSAHTENRIKNEELDGILAQYPSDNCFPTFLEIHFVKMHF